MPDRFDALIIGAGPAGAAAGLRLVRAGARVLLIDRDPFPREKPCGGALSRIAVRRLRSLGIRPSDDTKEIESGAAEDCNENGIPDECDIASGSSQDTNANGIPYECHEQEGGLQTPGDFNQDGGLEISDAVGVLGGPALAEPGPPPAACGLDPDPPGSVGDLGCAVYQHCRQARRRDPP